VNETVTKRDDPPMIAEARGESRFPFEHLIEGFTGFAQKVPLAQKEGILHKNFPNKSIGKSEFYT